MNGIEILNENYVYVTEYCWWLIPVFAGIAFLVTLIMAIIDWRYNGFFDDVLILIIIIFTLFGTAIGVLFSVSCEYETDTIDYIEYKVTIDDSVSMTEFMDKYEILDQEGKIYTIREKE